MSGPRRDSNDGARGNNLHGRGHKSVDGHGKHQLDDNAHPPGQ